MQLPLEITLRLVRMIQVWVESGQTPRCSFPCICATTSIMYHLFIGSNVGSDGVLSMSFLFSRDNIPGGRGDLFLFLSLSIVYENAMSGPRRNDIQYMSFLGATVRTQCRWQDALSIGPPII